MQTIELRRPAPAAWRANRHAKLPASPPSSPSLLRLDLFGGSVPQYRGSAEIRLIGHVARESSMVADYHIFDNWLAGTHSLEEIPEMRFELSGRNGAIAEALRNCFFARRQVMLVVPFLDIFFA